MFNKINKLYLTTGRLIETEQKIHQCAFSTTTKTNLCQMKRTSRLVSYHSAGKERMGRLEAVSYNGNHLTRMDRKVYMSHYRYLLQCLSVIEPV